MRAVRTRHAEAFEEGHEEIDQLVVAHGHHPGHVIGQRLREPAPHVPDSLHAIGVTSKRKKAFVFICLCIFNNE
jgi:hypothetical protein